jgi:uncharacterized protein YybS (DUF2232 family)
MTPTLLVILAILAALVVAILAFRRLSRLSHMGGPADLGFVSTRWIAELRRDDPL